MSGWFISSSQQGVCYFINVHCTAEGGIKTVFCCYSSWNSKTVLEILLTMFGSNYLLLQLITTSPKGPCLGSYSVLCSYFLWAVSLELTGFINLGKANDCSQVRLHDYLGDIMLEGHFILSWWMCQCTYLALRASTLEVTCGLDLSPDA